MRRNVVGFFFTIAATFRSIYGYFAPFYNAPSGWLKLELLEGSKARNSSLKIMTLKIDKDASINFDLLPPENKSHITDLDKESAEKIKKKIKKLLNGLNIWEIENLAHHIYFSRRKNTFYPADLFVFNPRTKERFFVLIHPHTTTISDERILAARNLESLGVEVRIIKVETEKILKYKPKPKPPAYPMPDISMKEIMRKIKSKKNRDSDPQLYWQVYRWAQGYAYNKEYEKAEKLFEIICSEFRTKPCSRASIDYKRLGDIKYKLRKYREAVACYERAKELIKTEIKKSERLKAEDKDWIKFCQEYKIKVTNLLEEMDKIKEMEFGDLYYFEKEEIKKLEGLINKAKNKRSL